MIIRRCSYMKAHRKFTLFIYSKIERLPHFFFLETKFWCSTVQNFRGFGGQQSDAAAKVHRKFILFLYFKKRTCAEFLFFGNHIFLFCSTKSLRSSWARSIRRFSYMESTQKVDIISVFQKQFLNLIFCSHYKTSEEFVGKINKALQLYEGTQKDHSIH